MESQYEIQCIAVELLFEKGGSRNRQLGLRIVQAMRRLRSE